MKIKVLIEGMSCGHCAKAVEEEFEAVGISVSADFKRGMAVIKSKEDISDERIAAAVQNAGFKIRGIER